jgi:hypothetical protein
MNTSNANKATSFSDIKGVVAVSEHVPAAGAIIWWRLSGEVDYDTIRAAWLAAGLREQDLLEPCSPTVALSRAVGELREKRMLVRPMGKGNGFVIVRESVVDDSEDAELEHENIAKIALDEVGRIKVSKLKGGLDHDVNTITQTVVEAFKKHLNTLDTQDFSHWLVSTMPKLDAVSLRDKGGIYFVPNPAVEAVERMVRVLKQVSSHVVNRVPAMKSESAVEAILDAITQEAEREAAHLAKVLEEGKLGEVGRENRAARCEEVEEKVTRYEELLGQKLDTVRAKLEALRAQLTIAVFKSGAADSLVEP